MIESFKRGFLAAISENKMNRIESTERLPGAPGEGMKEEHLKLDRYAILMAFSDDAEIPVKQLAEQFQTSTQSVVAMISGAKRSTRDGELVKLLAGAGYSLADLPPWFGAVANRGGELAGTAGAGGEATLFHKVQPSLGTGYSRTQKTAIALAPAKTASSATTSATPAGKVTITVEQQRLLSQHGVIYNEINNNWVRTVPQGKGVYSEVVDPHEVLIQLEAEQTKSGLVDDFADYLLDSVKINTQSILKKVTLNPSVFQCFQYVSSVRDPKTRKVLFGGDFGDYISYSVLFTTRTMFGVEPSFITDLPSIYKMYKDQQYQSPQQPTHQLGYMNPASNPQQGFRIGATSLPHNYRDLEEEE